MATTNADASLPSAKHSLADTGAAAVLAITLLVFVAPMEAWLRLAPASPMPAPGFELRMLAGGALLALILPLVQIYLQIRAFGGTTVRGNRVGFPDGEGAGGRVSRAHRNLIESLVPFAAAVLALQAFGHSDRATVAAAGLYLAARVVHAGTYAFGITVVRSAAFYAGLAATAIILFHLPLNA